MMISLRKQKKIVPEFVKFIPDDPKEGILYISTQYATATHKCPCGCGEIVVTPIKPTDWTLIWDGEHISLEPSIGSWTLPCRSHYWIRKNRIVWARKWELREIELKRKIDAEKKAIYYSSKRRRNG